MILVDTSIWIDHLRTGNPKLAALLQNGQVLAHPFVPGQLALGNLARRNEILGLLRNLPQVGTATDPEVLVLIEKHRLFGRGIGFINAHLLAATALTPGTGLWTRDQRLAAVSLGLGLSGAPLPEHRGLPPNAPVNNGDRSAKPWNEPELPEPSSSEMVERSALCNPVRTYAQ